MYELLPITWYFDTPIDYEHKLYTLLAYLLIVDKDFLEKVLSPHLLHLEKLHYELMRFNNEYTAIIKSFKKNEYVYFNNQYHPQLDNVHIVEVKDIVDFSIPLIQYRLDLGNKLLSKKNQLLY